jgi:hypothetical protein
VLLSLPAFSLMLRGGSSPQPPVHPILSSLFRISDGIRMTTHLMLFLSEERTRLPHEPTSAVDLYDFAERNGLFLSSHGVCAGPKPLIDEFLSTAFDGTEIEGTEGLELPPEIKRLLAQLPEAIDYALLGLQSWAVSRSIWLAMSRAYRTIREVLEASMSDAGAAICGQLRERVRGDWKKLDQGRLADVYEHDVHVDVYTDTYEQSWRALRSPIGAPTLAERIAPDPEGPRPAAVAGQLRDLFGERFSAAELRALGGAAALDRIVSALVLYLREEQAILQSTEDIQAEINRRLERARPSRPLTARDLRVNFAMYGGSIAEFPYLFDTLEEELGIRVECTADAIEVTDLRASRTGSDPRGYASASAGAQ